MSKKVLVISASPRKGGNSDMLCDRFILGAKGAGNNTEKIFLRDKEINYCVACYGCRGFTSCLDGAEEKGIIYGTGAWNIGDIQGSRAMEQAYEMGESV